MTMRAPSAARRPPGRPPAENSPDARAALLDAASRLFAAQGVDGVSLRRVADEAGVSAAMVHYYFGSKEGLYSAMLERTFGRVLERVRSAMGEGRALDAVLPVLFSTIAAEPWVPTLVVREVLTEGGRFREQFIEGYASHMAELLPSLMRSQIQMGEFRKDLDPTLAFMSLLGMCVMPFVARPVVERVLGIEYDKAFVDTFAAHTHRLFVEGARS